MQDQGIPTSRRSMRDEWSRALARVLTMARPLVAQRRNLTQIWPPGVRPITDHVPTHLDHEANAPHSTLCVHARAARHHVLGLLHDVERIPSCTIASNLTHSMIMRATASAGFRRCALHASGMEKGVAGTTAPSSV